MTVDEPVEAYVERSSDSGRAENTGQREPDVPMMSRESVQVGFWPSRSESPRKDVATK